MFVCVLDEPPSLLLGGFFYYEFFLHLNELNFMFGLNLIYYFCFVVNDIILCKHDFLNVS